MANPRASEHNPHAQSLAYLNDAGKVSGFEFENKEHISKNPSDLQQIAEAQVVSSNKDSFVPEENQPVDLQSGPPKKYIDQPNEQQQQQNAVPLSNFAHASLDNNTQQQQQNNNTAVDSFIPPTNENDKQTYESFFGDENNQNNTQSNDNANAPQPTDDSNDIFGDVMEQKQNENQNNTEYNPLDNQQDNDEVIQEKKEEKQTFLSVWQEQHREQLAKKAQEEREAQDKFLEKAKEELDNFNEKRRARMESQRKDAQSRESDLRDDYNSVFQHGTIWQQVAKLVDLKNEKKEVQRMRDLLIILKNQDEKKSDQ